MDKISEEDRIKRAEEISARRNNRIPASNINTKQNEKKISTLSKIFIQVLCSICIFGAFYFVNQNNSIAIEKIRPILSEDTDFNGIFNKISDFFKNISNVVNKDLTRENEQENNIEENITQETETNEEQNDENTDENKEQDNENTASNEEQNSENKEDSNGEDVAKQNNENGGVGGGDEKVEISETDQDIIFIKENANFIKPVVGYITSGYGSREPTDIISANHAGVDIGANTGTEIVASMSGTVELVSSYGDYGNHLQITNGEITTLYAHCSQIIVNQGDYINQGQKIAEVGSTRTNNRTTFTF